MKSLSLVSLLPLLSAVSAAATFDLQVEDPAYLFSNPPSDSVAGLRIPTSRESAVLGRRILALSKFGDIATTFPQSASSADNVDALAQPEGLAGVPIGLMDYFAECEDSGNPTILALKISTYVRNAAAGSNTSLSVRWIPPYAPAKRMSLPASLSSSLTSWFPCFFGRCTHRPDDDNDDGDKTPDTAPYSAANLPRFSLLGYLEPIEDDETPHADLSKCYVAKHPDARYWLPGNPIHRSGWARLVVTQIYWVGGFGDRAFIGWIPIEEWNSVTKEEWKDVRLPGEKEGWSEWSASEL